MFKPSIYAVLLLKLLASSVMGGDGLFSEVTADSVFSSSEETNENRLSSPKGSTLKLNTTESLIETLLAAGFTSQTIDENTVSIMLQTEQLSKPVLIIILDSHLSIRMPLQEINANTITLTQMMGLMKASHAQQPATFTINPEKQRIELITTIDNQRLSGSEMRKQLLKLGQIADETRELWAIGSNPQVKANATTTSLTGKWIATPSTTEAFALQLDADNSFKLVNVKGKSTSKSQGRFTFTGNTLSLSGDSGTTLTGTVKMKDSAFDLEIGGKLTLSFKQAP